MGLGEAREIDRAPSVGIVSNADFFCFSSERKVFAI